MNKPSEKRSDHELVQLTLKHKEVYGFLIERYEAPLLRYIRRLTNVSDEDAEDLLQEVFIKAYQNLRDVDEKQSFSAWIYRIARNHVISNFRKRNVRPEGHAKEIDDHVFENLLAEFHEDSSFDKDVLRSQLVDVFTKLDQKYLDVLILKYFQDKSYEEMAYIMQKPPGTIATLLNRAKRQFKKQAQALGITFEL